MTNSSGQATVDPRDFRVSDSEREHVVSLLQRAIGRGLIDLDEFTERTDIAYAARTRGQLNVVLTDLPGLVHTEAPRPGEAPPPPSDGSTPHPSATQPMRLIGHYSTITRNGRWTVPGHIQVRNKYGNTKLDFAEAEFTTSEVFVDVDSKWGSVKLTIPHGAAIDVNAINEIKHGKLDDRTGTNGKPGNPRIVVSGRLHGGNLLINPERRGFFHHDH